MEKVENGAKRPLHLPLFLSAVDEANKHRKFASNRHAYKKRTRQRGIRHSLTMVRQGGT